MRNTLYSSIEAQRSDGPKDGGPFGAFKLLCPSSGRSLNVIVYDGRDAEGASEDVQKWEHVSVSRNSLIGVPSWEEMCWIKDVFWNEDEYVVEYHPPKSVYVNNHSLVLHLWKMKGGSFPVPPIETV